MPLLDIPTGQPSSKLMYLQLRLKPCSTINLYLAMCRDLASVPKSFQVPRNGKNCNLGSNNVQQGVLVIRAGATLEPQRLIESNGGQDGHGNPQLGGHSGSDSGIQNRSSSEDPEQLSEREKLRQIRISTAKKGLTPWNKGRKLSAEARQRIKERTKLAMQNPQVRTKLLNLGHAQSKETRIKIGAGVRMWWKRHREKLMLQETCYFDWQNLIAEASRRGFVGQEELQWDSYKILSEQLEQERLESIELRRRTTGVKGNKNIPKSLEHRRKISEAITAKWADPEWLERIELRKQARRLEGNKKAPKSLEQRGEISEAITAKWADPMDNFPTTGSVRTTLGEKHRLAKSSLAFKSKKKLVPDYVEKHEQQQLSNQPVPEQVSPVPNRLENSTPLLDKTGVSK